LNIRPAKPRDQADIATFDYGSNEPNQAEVYEWVTTEAWEWSLTEPENRLLVLVDDDASIAGVSAYEPGADVGTWFFKALGIRRDLHNTRHLGTILFQQCLSDLIEETGIGAAYWKVHPETVASLKISRRLTDDDGYEFLGNQVFSTQWGVEDL